MFIITNIRPQAAKILALTLSLIIILSATSCSKKEINKNNFNKPDFANITGALIVSTGETGTDTYSATQYDINSYLDNKTGYIECNIKSTNDFISYKPVLNLMVTGTTIYISKNSVFFTSEKYSDLDIAVSDAIKNNYKDYIQLDLVRCLNDDPDLLKNDSSLNAVNIIESFMNKVYEDTAMNDFNKSFTIKYDNKNKTNIIKFNPKYIKAFIENLTDESYADISSKLTDIITASLTENEVKEPFSFASDSLNYKNSLLNYTLLTLSNLTCEINVKYEADSFSISLDGTIDGEIPISITGHLTYAPVEEKTIILPEQYSTHEEINRLINAISLIQANYDDYDLPNDIKSKYDKEIADAGIVWPVVNKE